MAIHGVHRWIETVTVNVDAVVQDQEIAVAGDVEADLDHLDHGEDRETVIVIVEKTKIKSELEKWNGSMKGSVVGRDCTILKKNI